MLKKRVDPRANRGTKAPYHHGDLERATVDLAVEVISAEGFEELTLRKLSARLGVSPTAIYRHFSDKQSLITRLAEEGFVAFGDALQRARDKRSAEHSIVRMTVAYVRFAHERPAHYRVMFGGHITERGHSEALQAAGDRSFRVMADEVVKEIQAGRFRADLDPMQVAVSIWSLVHGFASLSINGLLDSRKVAAERGAVFAMKALIEGYRV
jgi:AcrR family transcriptional regulator